MARNGWHILWDGHGGTDGDTDGATVTVTRRLPVVWDVAAETRFAGAGPATGRLRLAQQVRQDLWRTLRTQRGFAPAVRVTRTSGGLTLRAGGRVAAPYDRARLEDRIAGLLADPDLRRRWLACAASRNWAPEAAG